MVTNIFSAVAGGVAYGVKKHNDNEDEEEKRENSNNNDNNNNQQQAQTQQLNQNNNNNSQNKSSGGFTPDIPGPSRSAQKDGPPNEAGEYCPPPPPPPFSHSSINLPTPLFSSDVSILLSEC
jgi:hypothetical protein